MKGGNTRCQNSLLSKLKKDKKNKMILNICEIVKDLSKFVCKNYKIKIIEKKKGIKINFIDNYDFLENGIMKRVNVFETEDPKDTILKKESKKILHLIFTMLQLFCENNNVDFKNFLR